MLSHLKFNQTPPATGVVITNGEGQILDANTAFCRLLGYSQLKNQQLSTLIQREINEDQQEYLLALSVEFPLPTLHWEMRLIHFNTSLVWMHVSLTKVFDEVTGKWHGVFMTLDMSEQKYIEKELQKYQQVREILTTEMDQRVRSHQVLLKKVVQRYFSKKIC